MPTSYAFITCKEGRVQDASTKAKIRKHAMKDIGFARRRPQIWHAELAVRESHDSATTKPTTTNRTSKQVSRSPAEDQADSNPNLAVTSYRQHQLPFAAAPTRSFGTDPFDVAPILISSTINRLLQYFDHYSSKFPNNFTWTPCVSRLLNEATHDELLMNCILSAAASRVQYIQGVSSADVKKQELSSTQQGLQLLRHSITDSAVQTTAATERVIACVLYLGAAAFYRKDLATSAKHIDAAVKLANSIGGVTRLQDPQTLVRLVSMDDALACAELRPCALDCTYDPGPLKFDGSNHNCYDNLSDLFKSECGQCLPSALQAAVPAIVECRRAKYDLEKFVSLLSPPALQVRQWVILRSLAIRNRLLKFYPTDRKAVVVRMALILWTLLPPCDPRQAGTAQIVTRSIAELFTSQDDSIWDGHDTIRFWCLLVGFYSAQELSETRTWFADTIRETVHVKGVIIGVRNGTALTKILSRFRQALGLTSLHCVSRPMRLHSM